MRGDEGPHAEHVKILDALSSNLKSEVSRGLKILDSCVTQIAQARWILTNVGDSLSGFEKGCPVCGILTEKDKQAIRTFKNASTANSNFRESPVAVEKSNPRSSSPVPHCSRRSVSPVPINKPSPKKPPQETQRVGPRSQTKPSDVSDATAPSKSVKSAHRVGPRSKTVTTEAAVSSQPPAPVSRPKEPPEVASIVSSSLSPTKVTLPKKLKIVVSQTKVTIPLKDVQPYLRGLGGFGLGAYVSPKTEIPDDLVFDFKAKPKTVKSLKAKPTGAASRKFLESLKPPAREKSNPSSLTKKKTPLAALDSSSDDDQPLKPPPSPVPPKKEASDSASDYDYNFAKSAPAPSTSFHAKKKKNLHSAPRKRPRHHSSSNSDSDYNRKKKKISIFKKKVKTSSSDTDSDSDEYEKKRKKKNKRKDSTDKEKERHHSKLGSISKSSSVVSATRVTTTVQSKSEEKKSGLKIVRRESNASQGGGSTSSTTWSVTTKHVSQKTGLPQPLKAPADSTPAPTPAMSSKPGPASRKIKAVVTSTTAADQNAKEANSEGDTKAPESVPKVVNGVKNVVGESKPVPARPDPFALLKKNLQEQQKSDKSSEAVEKQEDTTTKPKAAKMSDKLLEKLKKDPKAKAAMIAALKKKTQVATAQAAVEPSSLVEASSSATVESPASAEPPPKNPANDNVKDKKAAVIAKISLMIKKNQVPVPKPVVLNPLEASSCSGTSRVPTEHGEANPVTSSADVAPMAEAPMTEIEPSSTVLELPEENLETLKSPVKSSVPAPLSFTSPCKSRSDAEDGIELGDDIIGKCIGNLTDDDDDTNPTLDPLAFTLSPMPPPTLQDCISPTGVNKFFQNLDNLEPNSGTATIVEKIQSLLAKLLTEKDQETVLLHSQYEISRIFEPSVMNMKSEVEVMRSDMEDGQWYLSKLKTLGKAVCTDTLAVFEWDRASSEELSNILIELEKVVGSRF